MKSRLEKEVEFEATVRNILLSLVDFGVIFARATKGVQFYRRLLSYYWRWREKDRITFSKRIYYLKQKKLIRIFVRGKKQYIELTPKGKKRARDYFCRNIRIKIRNKWDGKWRIVIFDISESHRDRRDTIRRWLKNLGLVEIQKSVYVYPFDFKRELDLMVGILILYKDVKYMISEIIQGEETIIEQFLEEGILSTDDLEREKKQKL